MISASFTRPANTTAYVSGQLVANSTVAASVAALAFLAGMVSGSAGLIRRARLRKSTTTTANGLFRLHLYGTDPALASGITNGDGGVWLTKHADYLGSIDFDFTAATARVFSDAVVAQGVPGVGSEIRFQPDAGQNVYGLLEARAGYVPGNAEAFTVILEAIPG